MLKRFLMASAVLGLLALGSGVVFAQGGKGGGRPGGRGPGKWQPGENRPPMAEMFKRMDRNGDGKLSQDEVPAPMWQRLDQAEAIKDGAVTQEGLAGAFKRMMENSQGPEAMLQRLREMDKNGDGKITKEEAGEAWGKIGMADANKDEAVTRDEVDAMIKKMSGEKTAPTKKERPARVKPEKVRPDKEKK